MYTPVPASEGFAAQQRGRLVVLGPVQPVIHFEHELDALPLGARLRFIGSGVGLEKVLGGLWRVDRTKGVWTPEDIVRNRNPMEVIE
jgi:hypothetical protein